MSWSHGDLEEGPIPFLVSSTLIQGCTTASLAGSVVTCFPCRPTSSTSERPGVTGTGRQRTGGLREFDGLTPEAILDSLHVREYQGPFKAEDNGVTLFLLCLLILLNGL